MPPKNKHSNTSSDYSEENFPKDKKNTRNKKKCLDDDEKKEEEPKDQQDIIAEKAVVEEKKGVSSLEAKLKMKREKLTIAIPEGNGKLPYPIPNSRIGCSPSVEIARKNTVNVT